MAQSKIGEFLILDLCRNQLGQIGHGADIRPKIEKSGRGVVVREDKDVLPVVLED